MIGAHSRLNPPGGFSAIKRKSKVLFQAQDIKEAACAFLERRHILPYGEHTHFSQFKTK